MQTSTQPYGGLDVTVCWHVNVLDVGLHTVADIGSTQPVLTDAYVSRLQTVVLVQAHVLIQLFNHYSVQLFSHHFLAINV